IFPEWDVNSSFSNHVRYALTADAQRSSHPIEVDCPDANFINQIFDGLSYSKAAAVLRMLSDYVGEEKFLEGVSLYLKNKLYGNSVTNDLWDGISKATGLDIHGLMDNWMTKIGFPLITVTETPDGIHVRQDRFLENGDALAEENETIWFVYVDVVLQREFIPNNRKIPLGILTVDEGGKPHVDKTAILDEKEKTIAIDTTRNYKVNAGSIGFCAFFCDIACLFHNTIF
ncbi:hypothetical protein C8J57DRAFT_1061552, partial [Mycena rebaudengoi]